MCHFHQEEFKVQSDVFFLSHDFFFFFFFRIGEDEVHVTARCSDPAMEPLYDEAGAFRGSHIGEQQRR